MELAFISGPDMVIIFIVALVVFGPKRLPDVGRQIGQMVRELRKVTGEFTDVFHETRDDFRQVVTISDPPDRLPERTALDQEYEERLISPDPRFAARNGGHEDGKEWEGRETGMVVSTVPHGPSEGGAE